MDKVCNECREIIYSDCYKLQDEDGLEFYTCQKCIEENYIKTG